MANSRNAPPRRRRRQSGQPQAELLQAVLDRARIREWDLLLIGDGSGSGWNLPCGWAATLIDRWTRERPVFFGAANVGSVNLAEMMPYLQALTWYHSQAGAEAIKRRGVLKVHVISDSRVIVNHGRRAANPGAELPKVPQRALWAAMREFGHIGYHLTWHWAARSTNSLNFLADLIAALGRREVLLMGQDISRPTNIQLAQRAAEALGRVQFVDPADGEQIDVYALNPLEVADGSDNTPSDPA